MCYSVHFIVILLRDQYKWELRLRQATDQKESSFQDMKSSFTLLKTTDRWIDRWMSGERQRCVCVFVCVCYRSLQTVQEVSFVFVRSEWLICLSFSFPICPSCFDTYVTLPCSTPSVIRHNPLFCWPLTSPSNRFISHTPDSMARLTLQYLFPFPFFHISCYSEF